MLGGVLVAALALAPPPAEPAEASPEIVGVAPLQVSGELPPRWIDALEGAVDRGLDRARFSTRGLTGSCADAPCWARRGRERDAKLVVVISITESFKVYELQARIVRVRDAEVIATANDTCEVCGLVDVEERAEALAATLGEKLDASLDLPPRLLVQSEPSGARVLLDEVEIGRTPLTYETTAGPHRLRVELPGHTPAARDLELVAGVDETVRLSLPAQTGSSDSLDDRSDPRARTRPLVIGGWATLGAGLATIAGGITLVVLDSDPYRSRCSGRDLDVEGNCRFLYDTLTGGIAMAAVGGALAITGATLLGIGYRRRVRMSAGLRSVSLEVRF